VTFSASRERSSRAARRSVRAAADQAPKVNETPTIMPAPTCQIQDRLSTFHPLLSELDAHHPGSN
jgi:hypothetical protein